VTVATEQRESFECFGSHCTVIVAGGDPDAAARAKRKLLDWHERFSRFIPGSELSRLNADPRTTVPISPLLRRQIEAALKAAQRTGGLIDPTLGHELARAGYRSHFDGPGIPLELALALAPPRAAARPSAAERWRQVNVDRRRGTVTRPAGVVLELGGIAKGVFADELSSALADGDAFAIDCGGDLRLGGADGVVRDVHVASPFDESVLHTFELASGGVATSGIGRRSWLSPDARPAHHLLDPRTGEPAYTGLVQVTALAPTATEAEALSKAALLSGPASAGDWLIHGGVIVYEDGGCQVV
jgi:thiamine biosynthesis lipoprotein